MNNRFFKSTMILMVGSLITRVLGFIIRVVFTRVIGSDGINLYSLIMPTYSLLITLAQMGFPIAISNLVAKGEKGCKKILFSIIPVSLIFNLVISAFVFCFAPFLANTLLKNPNAYYPIISIAFVIPFVSLSSIIRGYFFGKQKMFPHTLSNVIEQIVRLVIILFLLPSCMKFGTVLSVTFFILFNIISEIISIIVFLFFLPKKFSIKKEDVKPDMATAKEVMEIALPSTSSRIIGNIGYFFEPIILTNILMFAGYNYSFIIREYGIYNAYVIPVLTIPAFFITALSTAIVPEVSKYSENKKMIKRRLYQSLGISFIIGFISSFIIMLFPDFLLETIYNTTDGVNYVKFLAPFFILFYLEAPLISVLQGLNEAKYSMKVTLFGIIIKLIFMTIISLLRVGIYGLIASEVINILFVLYFNFKKVMQKIK